MFVCVILSGLLKIMYKSFLVHPVCNSIVIAILLIAQENSKTIASERVGMFFLTINDPATF